MEDTYQDTLGKMSTGHNRAELPTGIHLYLFGEKVENLTLPIYPEGRYQFEGKEDLLYIEGSEEKWRAYAKNDASFYVKNNEYKKIALQDRAMTILKQGDSFFFLYCEYINKESRIYHNYFTGKKDRICIGKDPANDLIYYNPLISDFSFAFERRGKAWEVVDCKDSLFLYVNGKRKEQKRLYPGDKLSFLGLHIIIGYQFFSVTDGNNRIHTCKESLKPVIFPYDLMCGQDSSDEHVSQKLIHRSPRRRLPMKPEEIRFEAPPMSLNHDQ